MFCKNPTAKFKRLESNQDKTHTVSLHQVLDKQYLDQLEKRERIAWPWMADNNAWEHLDCIVSNHLQNSASFRMTTGTGKTEKCLIILELISVIENVLEILHFDVFKYSMGKFLKMYFKVLEFETQ